VLSDWYAEIGLRVALVGCSFRKSHKAPDPRGLEPGYGLQESRPRRFRNDGQCGITIERRAEGVTVFLYRRPRRVPCPTAFVHCDANVLAWETNRMCQSDASFATGGLTLARTGSGTLNFMAWPLRVSCRQFVKQQGGPGTVHRYRPRGLLCGEAR